VKRAYITKSFRPRRAKIVKYVDGLLDEYAALGLRVTLRQIYYRLVAANIISNTAREYYNLSDTLSDARLAGLLDWDQIVDLTRVPEMPSEFANLAELVDAALVSYRLPRWADQPFYCEVWSEKAAIVAMLSPLGRKHHVVVAVNRGYKSTTTMYEDAVRLRGALDNGRRCRLFYLGDHDPSGVNMAQDIANRLAVFGAMGDPAVEIVRLGLTRDQVDEYNLPPQPVKETDSRTAKYVVAHGNGCWEVDALRPEVLTQLVDSAIRT